MHYLSEDGSKRNNHLLVVGMSSSLAKIGSKLNKARLIVPINQIIIKMNFISSFNSSLVFF